jgi:hypothetical protein
MKSIRNTAEDILLKCGCSPALTGFEALRVAIEQIVLDPSRLNNVCKKLYPLVGAQLGIKDTTVRMHMWNALDYVQDVNGHEAIMEAIGLKPNPRTGRYTVRGFIGAVAMKVRREVEG